MTGNSTGMYTWENTETEDIWGHDRFDTIEDCIEDAVENYCKKPGDEIAIGICEDYTPYVRADYVLDKLSEDAQEECGEAAEDWPYFIPRQGYEGEDILQAKLDKIINEWLEETNQVPHFYHIKPLAFIVTIPGGDNNG